MKNKILIIDDDKEFLEELSETLVLGGFETMCVNDPDALREIVGTVVPDAILLDLKMPKKTGFQVAYELSEHPGWAQVPIIAMSAYFNQEKMSIPPMFRIQKCLKKPFNPLDVIAEINNVL